MYVNKGFTDPVHKGFSVCQSSKRKEQFHLYCKRRFYQKWHLQVRICDSNNANECDHTSAEHGPCISNVLFKRERCKYRTFPRDYTINNKGTIEEEVFIDNDKMNSYQKEYSQWLHPKNVKEELRIWRPCEYYHQLSIALSSSHSVLNYSNFLALSLATYEGLPSRGLLVLDEAHRLEEEIVKFTGISISKRRWKRYFPNLKMVDYGYNDIEKWIDFLIELQTRMFNLTSQDISEELAVEAKTDREKLGQAIRNILLNPKNWIVNEIKKENNEVTRVEFKPLDVSPYCKDVFEICNRTLMMSATILDSKIFCESLGLAPEEVKFIQVSSDFPLQNRPIYPLNTAYLNSNSLQQHEIQIKIARAIDNLMTLHRNDKGIIHTTSYKQLDFIKQNISQTNQRRLLQTNPEIQRDEVIAEHVNSTKPTVPISPSLYIGLNLKNDLSRFQIITKVPYPDLGDRWINEKRKINGQWYIWQTALRLVQGYGRSIRSKEDYAVTYVLDSGFENFVKKNKNIFPDWFTQAIQSDLLKAPLEHAAFDGDSSKVSTHLKRIIIQSQIIITIHPLFLNSKKM